MPERSDAPPHTLHTGTPTEAAVPAPPDEPARRHGRCRRWVRRAAIAVLALWALVTVWAVVYNAATSGYSRPARELYRGPYVQVDGRQVAYRTWGERGSPIVLLGGFSESTWVWHKVGPLLAAAGHRVYAVDMPPWGYTERRGPVSMEAWLEILAGFERELNINRPLLVGHSLGAGVVASDARARPEASAGVVLLDGDAIPFEGRAGWVMKLWVWPYNPALMRLIAGSDWVVGSAVRGAIGPSTPPLPSSVVDEFQRPFRVDGTADALKRLSSGQIPGLTLRQLGEIRGTRAVIFGSEDEAVPVSSGRRTAKAMGVPLEVIPGAGHISMLSKPREVAAAIARVARRAR